MIQPLNFNSGIKFCANEQDKNKELFKDFQKPAAVLQEQSVILDKPTLSAINQENTQKENIFSKIKNGTINTIKAFNTTTNTTAGIIKGLVGGSLATAAVGILGKNIKESKGQILGTLTGTMKDVQKVATKAILAAPCIITKAPVDNVKSLSKLPKEFYKNYLKGNKATAAVATAAGVAVLAFNTLKGKMSANMKNADVDHYTNTGHIKNS